MTKGEETKNLLRDFYAHALWQSFEGMMIINLEVIVCGRAYRIREDLDFIFISGFWKFNEKTRIYEAQKRWDLLGDDP